MPVYHVSNFDVSAVQIDLSANIFASDTLLCDYWVRRVVNFNSGGAIKDDTALNAQFKAVFNTAGANYVGTTAVTRGSSGRVNYASDLTTVANNVQFKDLGVIGSDHNLLSSSIYSNVTALCESNELSTSFNGKARAVLQGLPDVTGLREKMLASLNVGEDPDQDLGINEIVPGGIRFAFKVIRKLNLAGTNQDREIFIGILLEQSAP
jgi:hypothetical protein